MILHPKLVSTDCYLERPHVFLLSSSFELPTQFQLFGAVAAQTRAKRPPTPLARVCSLFFALFILDCLWYAALIRCFPLAGQGKRWPGPIPRGMNKRRFIALYMSKCIFSDDDELNEIVGHTYLFLKEQLEISTLPPSSGILHGTIIDQFIACGKSRDRACELASLIWFAVIENLEDNRQTFVLLKRLALEGDVFLPYPYARSYKVEWRILERLFTDFRDCLHDADYYDLLGRAKQKFQPIPAAWLGY